MIAHLLLALAQTLAPPPVALHDPRLVTLAWRENVVLRLDGRAGVESTILFGADEHIENVAIGDANAWQVTPNRRADMLFLKPLAIRARTNLTVVTDRHTYFFDLVAAPGGRVVYGLRLVYPEVARKPAPNGPAPALTAEEAALARGAVRAPVDPAALDFGYTIRGAPDLAPAKVYGDGQATYITWPKGAALPAILARDPHGLEGPINFSVQDDMIVIDGTPATIVLRIGKQVATIEHPPRTPAPQARPQ